MQPKFLSESGQAHVEYILLIFFLALAVLAALAALGPQISNLFSHTTAGLSPSESGGTAPELTPIQEIEQDFLARILAYYNQYGRWPRSWGDYRFSDIGLNPSNWNGPVEEIYWSPNGSQLGMSNKSGDNIQIYVIDLNGNRLHLYDGWNIWCVASSGTCYYHTVAPGNEVDISTIEVVIT
jgi:Flp pilus assembly pilin Flp